MGFLIFLLIAAYFFESNNDPKNLHDDDFWCHRDSYF